MRAYILNIFSNFAALKIRDASPANADIGYYDFTSCWKHTTGEFVEDVGITIEITLFLAESKK